MGGKPGKVAARVGVGTNETHYPRPLFRATLRGVRVMSIKLMTIAWSLKLDPAEKLVLLKLADWVNEERERAICWPSISKLADLTNVSESTVKRAIRSLEAAGHVTRELKTGETTRYHVHPRTVEDTSERLGTEGGVNLTRVTHDPPGGSPMTPYTKVKQKTSEAKASSVSRETAFDEQELEAFQFEAVEWARDMMSWSLIDANNEFNRFADSNRSRDRRYKDWMAAWRNWCRSPFCKTTAPQSDLQRIINEPLRG
jgi:DNA-binding MarR family transcriptional regulator